LRQTSIADNIIIIIIVTNTNGTLEREDNVRESRSGRVWLVSSGGSWTLPKKAKASIHDDD
jgi:hypothetical protein